MEATAKRSHLSDSPLPSPTSPPPPPPPPTNPCVATPCAACKTLRRRCVDKCILAPYFPPSEPLKFTTAHRVYGASNIIKFLQDLPEKERADAASSMVYEANARFKDPVYGCAGTICQLQKQVRELQTQLAEARVDLHNMQTQQSNLLASIRREMKHSPHSEQLTAQTLPDKFAPNSHFSSHSPNLILDENSGNLGLAWEPLWN